MEKTKKQMVYEMVASYTTSGSVKAVDVTWFIDTLATYNNVWFILEMHQKWSKGEEQLERALEHICNSAFSKIRGNKLLIVDRVLTIFEELK